MKENKVQLVFTSVDQQETLILAKEIAKQHLDAVQYVNNLYNPQFVHDNAQYLEGDVRGTAVRRVREHAADPGRAGIRGLDGQARTSRSPRSRATGGSTRSSSCTGSSSPAPNFSQQKVIDALNRDTHFDADGMIVPIDWTKQHNDPAGPNGTANQYAGKLRVRVAHESARREVRRRC